MNWGGDVIYPGVPLRESDLVEHVQPAASKAQCPPEKADRADVERLRRAAYVAKRLYPGPVGELLNIELRAWDEFGYRFGGTIIQRLVDHLLEEADQAE